MAADYYNAQAHKTNHCAELATGISKAIRYNADSPNRQLRDAKKPWKSMLISLRSKN